MMIRGIAFFPMILITVSMARAGDAPLVDFKASVQPILEARCASCHGEKQAKSGLRVDRRASLLSGGDSGEPAIVPGEGRQSLLIRAVGGLDADLAMPPKGKKLTPEEVNLLRDWVNQGATMPDSADLKAAPEENQPPLWSLQPLKAVVAPGPSDPWIKNPIDAFVLKQLHENKLEPSPDSEPRALIRRAHLLITGLPPTPEEVEEYVQARGDEAAYQRLIDGLLARPQYGERWAQHWLDVIRWAETWGYETNSPRPDAWPYRDWLIGAINQDMPYDLFIAAQVAGDQRQADAATGFLVAGPANLPGQIGKDEPSMRQARQDELDETVKTVSAAVLGLTVGCARCHDHKFDPISQRDYYAFQAIFAGMRYGSRRDRGPTDDAWRAQARTIGAQLALLREDVEKRRIKLGLSPAVSPERQAETFPPVLAAAARILIHATSDGSNPSLYELEIWSAAGEGEPASVNVALASNGGKASASSFALENQTRHPDNLIDGLLRDGGRFPWKASKGGEAWARVDLARPTRIGQVVWQRGFEGFPVDADIEVRTPEGAWIRVANMRSRMIHEDDRRAPDKVALDGVPRDETAVLVALQAKARGMSAERARLNAGPQVFAGTFSDPEITYMLRRGDPMQRDQAAAPDVPSALGGLGLSRDADDRARREALTRWLGSAENPLTARVIVNRVWQHHFGAGLVDTTSDFGRMGTTPSHPELLDWLAGEFIRNHWSLKDLHRLIMSSNTFRQSSAPRAEALGKDASTRMLWRFPPRRMEAEAIHDSILFVSGSLNHHMGGPGFDFFNQKGGLSDFIPRESDAPPLWRRMIYATKVRMQTVDVFGAFDCPDAGQMAPTRPRSITPVQALGLFNGGFVDRMSRRLADRVRLEAGESIGGQVRAAFLLALGRPPTPDEAKTLADLAERHGLEQVGRVLFNASEFVFLP